MQPRRTYTWSYMPAGATQFKPYDPASPPTDVAQTTTSNGVTMPYIVRVESFTQNRSGVSVAVLYNPAEPWDAWRAAEAVEQGRAGAAGRRLRHRLWRTAGRQSAERSRTEAGLRRGDGRAAAQHHQLQPVVQAEAALMAKEHVAETYGPFDFIFGTGSSGGAISQIMDQNAYPGSMTA